MSRERVYLGISSEYGRVYLTKHEWACDWYWSFGWLGNANTHFHFDSYLGSGIDGKNITDPTQAFDKKTWITQDQWWILRDLFIQAYALKKAAECYRYGGHQTPKANEYRIINPKLGQRLNDDLEELLDRIWDLVNEWKDDAETQRRKRSA